MKTINGPAIFLAQFADDKAPFNSLEEIGAWAARLGFKGIFSRLAANDFEGWAVLEWECCLKHQEDGAREGAAFIREHIIPVTDKASDDFADGGTDDEANKTILGIA